MRNKETNLDMFYKGVNHIASNHGFRTIEYNDEVSIIGNNDVFYNDILMLCNDLGISTENIESNEFGVDIHLKKEWIEKNGNEPFIGKCSWLTNYKC